ncbi:hypothetical protein P154DRAFT_580287 [Amniculicola lignicola CBS 123094]|uniref:Secreted protein n=1 Tax=Amniculicola lignicola CBS 123094 TaxID=1392246 RepID=A0A6A5W2K2_9PLEO|nr:hypothetical protein P154DRAFT_580287 [Amniculicola lignicola CBS 123094]
MDLGSAQKRLFIVATGLLALLPPESSCAVWSLAMPSRPDSAVVLLLPPPDAFSGTGGECGFFGPHLIGIQGGCRRLESARCVSALHILRVQSALAWDEVVCSATSKAVAAFVYRPVFRVSALPPCWPPRWPPHWPPHAQLDSFRPVSHLTSHPPAAQPWHGCPSGRYPEAASCALAASKHTDGSVPPSPRMPCSWP